MCRCSTDSDSCVLAIGWRQGSRDAIQNPLKRAVSGCKSPVGLWAANDRCRSTVACRFSLILTLKPVGLNLCRRYPIDLGDPHIPSIYIVQIPSTSLV